MKNKIIAKLSVFALTAFAVVLSLGYVIYNCAHKKSHK